MAGGRTVRIQILGDAKGAQGAFGQVESAAGSFASKIGTVAKGVAIGIGAIGVAAGAMAVTGIKAASDYEESWNKVGEVFGQNAGQIQDWSKNAAQSFGLSQSEALAATGTFGNLFTAMGIGSGAAADMSTDIVGLAADLGSFNNIGTDEALEKIRAGLVGETEPLRSLGVNLDAASIKAKAMAMGLADASGELTPAAKAQAAYALILEQTTTAQGDFARTKSGMANSLKIIGASFDDLKVNIGQRLLPVIAPLISSFASGMPRALDMAGGVLDRISDRLRGPLTAAFTTVRDGVLTFVQALQGNWSDNDNIRGIHRVIGQVGLVIRNQVIPAVQAMAGWFTGTLIPAIQTVIGIVGQVSAAFGEGGFAGVLAMLAERLGPIGAQLATWAGQVLTTLVNQIGQWAGAFLDWIAPMIPPLLVELGKIALALGTWMYGTALPAILAQLATWGQALIDWIGPRIAPMLTALGGLLSQLGAWLLNTALPAIAEKVGEWGSAFIAWIGPRIGPMLAELGGLLSQLGGWLIDTALPEIAAKVSEWGAAFIAWVGPQIPPLLSALGGLLGDLGNWIVSTALPEIKSKLAEWGSAFLNWVATDVLPQLPGKLAEIGTAVTGFILTKAGELGTALLGWATKFLVWIANDVLPQLPGKLAEILTSIAGWVTDSLGSLASEGGRIGLSILEGIASGIRDSAASIVGSAIDFVTGLLPEWVKKGLKIGSPSKVMHDEVGIPISQGIATGMMAGAGSIKLAWDWLFGGIMADAKDYAKQVGSAFEGLFGSISDLASGTSIKNAQAELDRLLTIRQIAIDTGAGEAAVAGIDAQIAEQQNRVQAIGAAMGTDIVRGITDQMQSADLAASLAESVSAAWSASLGNLDSILSGDRIGALQDTLRGLEQQLALALVGGAPEDVVKGIRENIAAVQRELGASQQIYDDAMNAGLIDTSVFQMPLGKISQLLPQMKDGGLSMIDELVRGVADGSASLGGAMATIQGIVAAGSDKLPETIGASVFEVIDVLKELDKSLTVDLAQALINGTDPSGIEANLAIVASMLGDLQAQADATAKSIKGVNAVTGQKIVRPDGRRADSGGSGFESAGGSGGGGTRIGGQTVLMMPDATPLLTWYAYESTQSEALWPVTG